MDVESWTIKKAESQIIDAFELWCWRRLLRVPWTSRRSYQSILREISPGCSLGGLMLKLKLQYFGYLMGKIWLIWKDPNAGKDEGGRRRGQQRMRWLDGITNSVDMSWVNSGSWWWTGRPGVLQFMRLQRVGHDWVTELNWLVCLPFPSPWDLPDPGIKPRSPSLQADSLPSEPPGKTSVALFVFCCFCYKSGMLPIAWNIQYSPLLRLWPLRV